MAKLDSERWDTLYKLAEHESALTPDSELDTEAVKNALHMTKILVLGAGGLGCEVLKDLALSGFTDIHVIDLDTIDVSNLNRQFLFTEQDVGKTKAEVAAAFVNARVEGCNVTAHVGDIKKRDKAFYSQFDAVISGLDSVDVRRWMNAMLVSIADDDKYIPFIDGGSEGFQGQVRVLFPRIGPCYECGMWMMPPQIAVPMCTIAANPRVPEHCVQYAMLEFQKKYDNKPDGDKVEDVEWCLKLAAERAEQFHIEGVDYRMTLGVIKNVIPAIASTNSIVAATCVNEALKLALGAPQLKNTANYSGVEQPNFVGFELFQIETCIICGGIESTVGISAVSTLTQLIEMLKEGELQMKNPSFLLPGGIPLYNKALKDTHSALETPVGTLFTSGTLLTVVDPLFPPGVFLKVTVNFE